MMKKPTLIQVTRSALLSLSIAVSSFAITAPAQAGIFSMSKSDEAKIGAEQHPKIMQQFGGAYGDKEIGAYVAGIVGRIANRSPIDAKSVRVTVLNSPVVNAMALPGGYVYATRGLLAMANSEAEVAGVMAHELGHVVARHSAERYEKQTKLGLGGMLASILLQQPAIDQLINVGGTMWLLKNSRDDEYEADRLGTSYIAKTGYDPYAMGTFLGKLDLQQDLQATLAGKDHNSNAPDFLSTHPNSVQRVRKADEEAKKTGIKPGQRPRREYEYLKKIDGLIYGDDPKEGFVRGQTFSHPDLKLSFTVPKGFRLINSPTAVNAVGPDNSLIRFTFGKNATNGNMVEHVKQWTKGQRIQDLSKGAINNMNGAHALIRNFKSQAGKMDVRVFAIEFSNSQVAQFALFTPTKLTSQYTQRGWDTANSFKRLSNKEASKLKPLRVNVVKVKKGDSVASLAKRMAFNDYRQKRFRTLNGMRAGDTLRAGDYVKIIRE